MSDIRAEDVERAENVEAFIRDLEAEGLTRADAEGLQGLTDKDLERIERTAKQGIRFLYAKDTLALAAEVRRLRGTIPQRGSTT